MRSAKVQKPRYLFFGWWVTGRAATELTGVANVKPHEINDDYEVTIVPRRER